MVMFEGNIISYSLPVVLVLLLPTLLLVIIIGGLCLVGAFSSNPARRRYIKDLMPHFVELARVIKQPRYLWRQKKEKKDA